MGKGSRTGHSRYRAQRARMLRAAKAKGLPCCYCGRPIDYDLPYPNDMSPSADHADPIKRGGRNYGQGVVLRPCHLRCNILAGDRYGTPDDGALPTATSVVVFESNSLRPGP